MWEDEAARCKGQQLPPAAPSLPRQPQVLGAFTEQYKQQLQAVAAERCAAERVQGGLGALGSGNGPTPSQGARPATPASAKSPLLSLAPAANRALLVTQLLPSFGNRPSQDESAPRGQAKGGAAEFVDAHIIATQAAIEQDQRHQARDMQVKTRSCYLNLCLLCVTLRSEVSVSRC